MYKKAANKAHRKETEHASLKSHRQFEEVLKFQYDKVLKAQQKLITTLITTSSSLEFKSQSFPAGMKDLFFDFFVEPSPLPIQSCFFFVQSLDTPWKLNTFLLSNAHTFLEHGNLITVRPFGIRV